MPLWRYVKKGVTFSPEEMAVMREAFLAAVAYLGIGPDDEAKREALARLILDYVRAYTPHSSVGTKHLDAAKILEATLRALSGGKARESLGS